MAEVLTVIKLPYLTRPQDRESYQTSLVPEGTTIGDVTSEFSRELRDKGYKDLVFVRNGIVSPPDTVVEVGDVVSIHVKHGFTFVQGLIWIALANSALWAAANVLSGILTTVLFIGGGILINKLLAPSSPSVPSSQADNSPSYSISETNPTNEGVPVPVVYGSMMTYPPIIGSYRRGYGKNMWAYFLLCLGEGTSGSYPPPEDVYIGDEKLTSFAPNYVWRYTQGLDTPDGTDEAALTYEFPGVWHDRTFDRVLDYDDFDPAGVSAQGTITLDEVFLPSIGDTLTIGDSTWEFVALRSDSWEITIGISQVELSANIVYAVNTDYGGTVTATSPAGVLITVNEVGAAGNSMPFTTTSSYLFLDGSGYLGGTTLGSDPELWDDVYKVTTNGVCDSAIVILDFPHGKFFMSGGVFTDYQVEFYVGYRESGDLGDVTWWKETTIGASTTAYKVEIVIDFPDPAVWDIYICRHSPDDPSDETTQRSTAYLYAVEERRDIFQVYPGMRVGVVGVMASEKISGAISKIGVIQNRNAVQLITDIYGTKGDVVDPTIPRWAFQDAFTNPRSGRGLDSSLLLDSDLDDWEDWTEGLVEGNRRSQLNIVFDEVGTFGDNCIRYIEEIGRAKISQIGNYWGVLLDAPQETHQYLFSADNMLPSSFCWESYEDPEKVDAVCVRYKDKDQLYKWRTTQPQKASWFESLTKKPRIVTLEIRGCNNEDQAVREAILYIQRTEMVSRHGKMDALVSAVGVEKNDRVSIIHPTNKFAFSGRTREATYGTDTIYLDQTINLPSATYGGGKGKIYVVTSNGAYFEYEISMVSLDHDTDEVVIAYPDVMTGERFSVWAIGRPNFEKLSYQISSKKIIPPTEDREMFVRLEFVEYNGDVYYNSNYGSGAVAI